MSMIRYYNKGKKNKKANIKLSYRMYFTSNEIVPLLSVLLTSHSL